MAAVTKEELAGQIAARLVEVEKELKADRAVTEHRLIYLETTLAERDRTITVLLQQNAAQDERIKALEKHVDHPATLSAHDQRIKSLEKGTDRLWQFAPLVLATFALLVSAYVAFVKK